MKASYNLQIGMSILQKPVIAVLTQPVCQKKKKDFHYNSYILEANMKFIEQGGAKAVPLQYDLSKNDLLEQIQRVDGVFFTGGGLELINPLTGEQSQYYKTAKAIFEYSKNRFDKEHEVFPLLGICQGFELLALLCNNDDIATLTKCNSLNENRKVSWKSNNVITESKLFSFFNKKLIDKMLKKKLVLHYHEYSITEETYNKSNNLQEMIQVISNDEIHGTSIITSFEGRRYPFYGLMYHPEFPLLNFRPNTQKLIRVNNDKLRFEILSTISVFFKTEAMKHEEQKKDDTNEIAIKVDNFLEQQHHNQGISLEHFIENIEEEDNRHWYPLLEKNNETSFVLALGYQPI